MDRSADELIVTQIVVRGEAPSAVISLDEIISGGKKRSFASFSLSPHVRFEDRTFGQWLAVYEYGP